MRAIDDGRAAARASCKGQLVIDAVVPDYYARRPKPCIGGWGKQHAQRHARRARCCPAMRPRRSRISNSDRPRHALCRDLGASPAFEAYRGTELDEGALPLLRAQGDRLRRLPLPGAGADRRRRQHGSGLPSCRRTTTGFSPVADADGVGQGAPDAPYEYRRFTRADVAG